MNRATLMTNTPFLVLDSGIRPGKMFVDAQFSCILLLNCWWKYLDSRMMNLPMVLEFPLGPEGI